MSKDTTPRMESMRRAMSGIVMQMYMEYADPNQAPKLQEDMLHNSNRILSPRELQNALKYIDPRLQSQLKRPGVTREKMIKEQLKLQIYDYFRDYRSYAEIFPASIQERYLKAIDSLRSTIIDMGTTALDRGIRMNFSMRQMLEAISEAFRKKARDVLSILGYYDKYSYAYQKLLRFGNAARFLFVGDSSEASCDRCISSCNRTFSTEELLLSQLIPPLHPNCGCRLELPDGNLYQADLYNTILDLDEDGNPIRPSEEQYATAGSDMDLPENVTGRTKRYLDYRKLTGGHQKQLQDMAYTDENGFRRIEMEGLEEHAYMAALGSYYTGYDSRGVIFQVELDTGFTFYLVAGDMKADVDTNETNQYTEIKDGVTPDNTDIIEFIMDTENPAAQNLISEGVLQLVRDYDFIDGTVVRITRLEGTVLE